MSSHVLVPYDGSDAAERGIDHAFDRFPDATVTVLSVVEPLSEAGRERSTAPIDEDVALYADGGPSAAEAFVGRRAGDSCGVDRSGDVRAVTSSGMPAAAIVRYADEHGVDAIVMGTSDCSGVRRALSGSVSAAVAADAAVPVTVVD